MAVDIRQYARQVGAPNTRLAEAGNLVAASDAGLFEAVGELAQTGAAVYNRAQLRKDELDLLDYERKLSEADTQVMLGDDDSPGAMRKMGVDADGITDATLSSFDQQATQLQPKLRTKAAQAKAVEMAAVRREDMHKRLANHEFTQGRVADQQITDATVAQFTNEAMANADDPGMVKASIARAQGAIEANGRRMGEAPAYTAGKVLEYGSKVMRDVVMSQVTRDPVRAIETYKDNAGALIGDDRLQVERAIQPYIVDEQSRSLARSYYNGTAPTVATGSGTVYDAIAQVESNDRHFDDAGRVIRGPQTSSGERAVGKFQIMPSTGPEAARLAGLKWDPQAFEKDPDYNAALGRAYLDQQIKRFGGNIPVVAAAYNMGPEAAAKWAAGEPYRTVSGKQWSPRFPGDPEAMPTETRKYVEKVTNRMGGPGEVLPPPVTEQDVNEREVAAIRRADKNPDMRIREAAINDIRFMAANDRKLIQERQRATQASKAEFTDRYNNVVAKLGAGVDVPIAERPTEAQLTAVYGEYEGPIKYKEMQTYAAMAPDIATLNTATVGQAAPIIAKYMPKPDSPNYAFDQKVYEGMQNAWKNVQTQRNADPAAFLMAVSPTVQERYAGVLEAREQALAATDKATQAAALGQMRQKGQAFTDFLLSEQARLGVPADKRKVMPDNLAAQVMSDFDSSMASGDIAGGVQRLRATVAMFGDGAAKAIPQLGANAGPTARMALEGIDVRTIESYVAAAAQGDGLKKSIESSAWNDMQDTVRKQLGALDATGATEWPEYFDITLKVAAQKVKLGMDPKQAATQAASETINSRYLFAGTGATISYRVPLRDPQGGAIDAQGVVRSATRTLDSLRPAEIGLNDAVPTGISTDEYKAYRIRRIQQTGKWLTSADESGLELAYTDDNGRLVQVKDAAGRPFKRTWQDLLSAPVRDDTAVRAFMQTKL